MGNTDRMSMLERWAIGMEKLEQYYEGKYGPPATPAQLPSTTTCDGMLEAIANGLKRAKRNINKKSPTYHSDSVAYVKTVPAGDVRNTSIEKLGDKTVVWNQLVVMSNQTVQRNGITYTTTSDGTVVINGTATATADYAPSSFSANLTIGHVYWLRGCPADSSASTYYLNTNNGACYADGLRYTANSSTTRSIHVRVESGVTANNVTFKVQCTDLTLMFGAGNEPTLDECKALFPAESYPYNAGELLSAGVTEVVSKKADTTEIATYPIPAEVRALSGYGWSCPSHYNYIDFEAKKFVQEVGSRAYASGDESDSTVITDGTTTYYPLNPAIETDISQYLTDDNLISVESGGTLTFPNSNGDDYRIPVPSSETFVVGEP